MNRQGALHSGPFRQLLAKRQQAFGKQSGASRGNSSSGSNPPGEGKSASATPFDVKVVQVPRGSGLQPLGIFAGVAAVGGAGGFAYFRYRQKEAEQAEARAAEEAAKKAAEEAAAAARAAAAEAAAAEAAKAAEAAAAAAEAARREEEAAEAARLAAEAARLAEEQAKKEAELKELSAACAKHVAEAQEVLNALEGSADFQLDLALLQEALAPAEAFAAAEGLQKLQDAGDAENLASSLLQTLPAAQSKLQRLQKISEAKDQYDSALVFLRSQRKQLLLGDGLDIATCESALARAAGAAEVLAAEGVSVRSNSVFEAMQKSIAEMEQQEEQQAFRDVCAAALESAVSALPADRTTCTEALAASRAVGCGPSPSATIAALLEKEGKEPSLQALIGEHVRALHPGVVTESSSPEEFAAAAAAATVDMDETALKEQAAVLARAVAVHHSLEAREMKRALLAVEKDLRRHLEERATVALQGLSEGKATAVEEMTAATKDLASQRCSEAAANAREDVAEDLERGVARIRMQFEQQLSAGLRTQRQALDAQLAQLPEQAIASVESVWHEGLSPEKRVETTSGLASALLSFREGSITAPQLGGGLEALRKAGAREGLGDGFVARVAAQLSDETVRKSQEEQPTSQDLSQDFHKQLPEFVAAAFEPPGAGGAGGLAANIAGRCFALLYKLKTEQEEVAKEEAMGFGGDAYACKVPEGDSEALRQQNLRTLARASGLVDRGELRGALEALEQSLGGQCRMRAERWMAEARHALMLQQAAQAVLARTLCLNASLTEQSGH